MLFLPFTDLAEDAKGTSAEPTEKSEWIHVKYHKGVNLYERLVSANALQVWERKGELVVTCDFDAVSKFFSSPENMKLWMKGVKRVNCLKTESRNKWTIHTIYRLPWPFENKDMISTYEFREFGTEKYLIQINSIDTLMEEKPQMDRIKNFRAICLITKINDLTTKIVFAVVCATPPMFPRWIQDPIIKGIFLKNMLRMKEQLSKRSKPPSLEEPDRLIHAESKP